MLFVSCFMRLLYHINSANAKQKAKKNSKNSKKGLQIQNIYGNILAVGYPGVAQLVARLTGGQEAVSSSLATRTILSIHKGFDL